MTKSHTGQPIRVIIVDDHPMILEGTRALLKRSRGVAVVGATSSGTEALELVDQLRPEVLLLDIRLPDISGIEVARRVRTTFPDVAVLVLTGYDDIGNARALVQTGVQGYIRKTVTGAQLVAAIHAVASGQTVLADNLLQLGNQRGESSFTDREYDVLRLIVAGHRNSEIAEILKVSVKTVEFHVGHILEKLRARSRAEAIRFALQQGLISLDDQGAGAH